jgi:hypothetical protein
MTNKQRHLVEIPEEVQTALLLTRHTDGRIGLAVPKGDPSMMEEIAIIYGIFVSLLQGAEQNGVSEIEYIRQAMRNTSLEDMRDSFVKMAMLAQMIREGEESND